MVMPAADLWTRMTDSWGYFTGEGYAGHLFPVIIGETGTMYQTVSSQCLCGSEGSMLVNLAVCCQFRSQWPNLGCMCLQQGEQDRMFTHIRIDGLMYGHARRRGGLEVLSNEQVRIRMRRKCDRPPSDVQDADMAFMVDMGTYMRNEGAAVDGRHSHMQNLCWWSWNPNSWDTGGIMMNDWLTVSQCCHPTSEHLRPPGQGAQHVAMPSALGA